MSAEPKMKVPDREEWIQDANASALASLLADYRDNGTEEGGAYWTFVMLRDLIAAGEYQAAHALAWECADLMFCMDPNVDRCFPKFLFEPKDKDTYDQRDPEIWNPSIWFDQATERLRDQVKTFVPHQPPKHD